MRSERERERDHSILHCAPHCVCAVRQTVTHSTSTDVRVSEDIVAQEAIEHLWGLFSQDNDLL